VVDPYTFNFKNKSILVTGAGRGIGRAIALSAGACGANVGVTYTGSSEQSKINADEVCSEITKLGGQSLAIAMDIGSEEQIEAGIKALVSQFSGLDGVVNNAGIVIDQLAMRYKAEDFDRLMSINVRGSFLVAKHCLRPLTKSSSPAMVFISSVVGQMGNAGQVPYSSTKAAIIGMTKSLAKEMAARKLRVNCIAPGFIATEMTGSLTEEQKDKILSGVPLAELGSPEDIAAAALFLLSPLSRYITGQVIGVNGGLYM
jgi:3-oxoacyl-[acyl-carrier protein] reductase